MTDWMEYFIAFTYYYVLYSREDARNNLPAKKIYTYFYDAGLCLCGTFLFLPMRQITGDVFILHARAFLLKFDNQLHGQKPGVASLIRNSEQLDELEYFKFS